MSDVIHLFTVVVIFGPYLDSLLHGTSKYSKH